jgi:hypothetical protein
MLAVAMFHLGRCLDARRTLTTLLQVIATAAATYTCTVIEDAGIVPAAAVAAAATG